ncbi:AraC family transcriptional regulator [Leptospira idonii]|uniref:AraC family transcriptional regulator n=1 Tax=Leptospira idonii TaxID=1193500 RepID=A0A4R9M1E0_9LEPT|nr:helix-turn-helix domain-containing protein [Leptospira idonii]TGN19069.1 AraC family transcriptional regulator [Leptospira idonii]
MDFFNLIHFLIGFSGGLAFLFCGGELVSKEKSTQTRIQAGLFFLAGIFQTHSFLVGIGGFHLFPHLYLIHLPFSAFFGALFKRYFDCLWSEENGQAGWGVLEFLPAVIVLSLLSSYYTSSAEEKMLLFRLYPQNGVPVVFKLAILTVVLPVFGSAYYVSRKIMESLRFETIKNSPQLRLVILVLGLSSLASLVGIVTLFFNARHGLDFVSCIVAFLLVLVYLLRLREPELFTEVKRIVQEEKKYQISQLKSVDIHSLGESLEKLVSEEKIYRNDELSLAELSGRLSVSPHQLSEYLNQHLGKNFFQYINYFRIQEAKELCRKNPEKTILSIAFEVGFPSKSTFYDAFRRETGMSPTEFRKNKK